MSERDERLNALRAAIEGLAADEAPKLVAEARAEARAKVRSMLSEAIAESLLDRSAREIGRPAAHSAPSEQKPASRTEGSSRSGSRKRGREAPPKAPQRPEGRAGDGLGYYLYGVVACGTGAAVAFITVGGKTSTGASLR